LDEEQVKTLLEEAMDVQRRQDAEFVRKVLAMSGDAEIRGLLAVLAEKIERNTIPPVSICRENGADDSLDGYTPI